VINMQDAVQRRRFLRASAGAALAWQLPALAARAAGSAAPPAAPQCPNWPAWQDFCRQFLRDGDRVIDPASERAHTVSEGQSYALFFALVANDRGRFERILRWTEDNLAGGDLALHLPAWQWGRRDDGGYGVLDANSAADADLWLVYVLGEAGRLWQQRRYLALSSVLAERILREESASVPGLGRTLLPGPQGFAYDDRRWRLNPCYTPLFLARWLVTRSADPRWAQVLASNLRLLRESAPRGFAPDWAWYGVSGQPAGGPAAPATAAGFDAAPPAADRVGSYDAVRVYLWLGITAPSDPQRAGLLEHFAPMADLVERDGFPPRSIDVFDGSVQGAGPAGFSAALLPFLDALQRPAAARTQALRLQAQAVPADAYFEQSLSLFALGWREHRYALDADGSLLPAWQCPQ
jgi:endoglucanase